MTDRDKVRLAGVHPTLISHTHDILMKFPMFVVSGVRTLKEQQELYLRGRDGKGGKIVTNCDGIKSRSNHQFHLDDNLGHAVDLAFIPTPERTNPFDPIWPWKEFGTYSKSLGLIWGGDFHSLPDLDHIELP